MTDNGPVRLPLSGLFHHGVPSFCSHPWCPSYTPTAPQSIVSGTRVPWHEGLKYPPADQLLVARLHVLLRRPGVIAVGVRPTIITTVSPWAAQWACGSSQLESDQQSSQLLSTSHQSGVALVVCDRPTFAHTRHSCTTPPKNCTTSMSPDMSCEKPAHRLPT